MLTLLNIPLGIPADTVTLLTSQRIRTDEITDPYLASTANAAQGVNTITVNAAKSNVPDSYLKAAPGLDNNASAFITFDTLQPNLGILVYQVTAFAGNVLTLSLNLDQTINKQSNAYSVVWKRIEVNADRELRVARRTDSCTAGAGFYYDTIVPSHGPGNGNGGVDGFQVEYVLADGTATAVLAANNIVNVRAIRIWLLLRSDFPAKDYKNTNTYTLGQAGPVNVGPFNDNYRRLLLTKTVEVKNVGF